MDDWNVSVAVEDKFVIFRLNKPDGLLPSNDLLDGLIASLAPLRGLYEPILDLGGVDVVTNDVIEFVEQWTPERASVIIDRSQDELLSVWPRHLQKPLQIDRRPWDFHELSLAHFLDENDIHIYGLKDELQAIVEAAGQEVPTEEEWRLICDSSDVESYFLGYAGLRQYYEATLEKSRFLRSRSYGESIILGARYLRSRLRAIGRNSLMTQLALVPGSNGVLLALPYHANALYTTGEATRVNALIVARPAVIASRTGAIFSYELAAFNQLLADSNATEHAYQKFFESNPAFLKMLGYKAIYPKVVLERDDGTSLSPDFMVEPFDREFWDILDIKRPDVSLVVGARDRKDFSSHVHQLTAQLREYGAYFDEEKNRKRIADRYGINAYKPRLVGIIGDHHNVADKAQLQRVMTQYSDTRLFTFSQIRQMAESRLLI